MTTETTPIKRRHPHDDILLNDDKTLECYPKRENNTKIVNAEEEKRLFIGNAFYLWEHREQILSNSRMFLCPIHVNNNLAYIGATSMSNATLGCYIEWWQSCEAARRVSKSGEWSFICGIGGSPLSGRNHCCEVYANGKTKTVHVAPFMDLWKPFLNICEQYAETSSNYQSFTLSEVIEQLRHEDESLLPPLTKGMLKERFKEYNKLYFGNKLKMPKFYFLSSKLPYGMCIRDKKQCDIWISKRIDWTDEFLKNILIHEMIHQYAYEVLHGWKYSPIQHGPLFHFVRWRLIKRYGLEIRPN